LTLRQQSSCDANQGFLICSTGRKTFYSMKPVRYRAQADQWTQGFANQADSLHEGVKTQSLLQKNSQSLHPVGHAGLGTHPQINLLPIQHELASQALYTIQTFHKCRESRMAGVLFFSRCCMSESVNAQVTTVCMALHDLCTGCCCCCCCC